MKPYDLRVDFGIWMAAFLCFGTVTMCKQARLRFNDQNIYLSGVRLKEEKKNGSARGGYLFIKFHTVKMPNRTVNFSF